MPKSWGVQSCPNTPKSGKVAQRGDKMAPQGDANLPPSKMHLLGCHLESHPAVLGTWVGGCPGGARGASGTPKAKPLQAAGLQPSKGKLRHQRREKGWAAGRCA